MPQVQQPRVQLGLAAVLKGMVDVLHLVRVCVAIVVLVKVEAAWCRRKGGTGEETIERQSAEAKARPVSSIAAASYSVMFQSSKKSVNSA